MCRVSKAEHISIFLLRAVVFTYFISSWCKGSDVIPATCCLPLGCQSIVCVCVCIPIYFLSSKRLKTCASQPCAGVVPTPALTHPPTFLPSIRPSLESRQTNGTSTPVLLGERVGENIWMPDRCLIRRFFSIFYKSADKQ